MISSLGRYLERKMNLGWAIVYVDNVKAVLDFYGKAFGLKTRFLHESAEYGELETGQTTLAFASHKLAQMNLPDGYLPSVPNQKPLGFEFAIVTSAVHAAYTTAIDAGATPISPPHDKPWGQTVSYVRSIEGTLISICTPLAPPPKSD